MPRPTNPEPTYVYKEKDRARIYWRGEFRDLPGPYRSAKSLSAYQSLCAFVASTGNLPPKVHESETITMRQLGKKYLQAMRVKHGPDSKEPLYISYAIKGISQMFGNLPVSQFRPSHLIAYRQSLVDLGLVRRTANKRTQQIVRLFQWAVQEDYAQPTDWHRLQAIEPIHLGQYGAVDNPPVVPVPTSHFEETLRHVPPKVADALKVLAFSGMRSGELLRMRPMDLDMSDRHWMYVTSTHKTSRKVGTTVILIPEPATTILAGHMPKDYTKRFFPHCDSWLHNAVERVCERHGIPHWHPHQLRHRMATIIAEKLDDKAAQKLLRHTDPKMTARYIQESKEALNKIADIVFPIEAKKSAEELG